MAPEQGPELFLAWAHSYRRLCAVCCVEDVHKHRPKMLTKIGPQKLTEERMVGVFVICGFFNLATAGSSMLPRHQVEGATFYWLPPTTSVTNT